MKAAITHRQTAVAPSWRGSNFVPAPSGMSQIWSSMGLTLFRADLRADRATLAELETRLSPDESARAARVSEPTLRRRVVARRALLRSVLAENLGAAAASIEFAYGEFGKPTAPGTGIDFSVSSSYDVALILLSSRGCVGVDIQKIDPEFSFESLLEEVLPWTEIESLRALPAHQRSACFFQAWTRTEAIGKALGIGLAQPIPAHERAPTRDGSTSAASKLAVQNLEIIEGYAMAVATKRAP